MDHSPPGSFVHGILQARITGVGCRFLFQEILSIQGSNLCLLHLLHWQAGSLQLASLGKPQFTRNDELNVSHGFGAKVATNGKELVFVYNFCESQRE